MLWAFAVIIIPPMAYFYLQEDTRPKPGNRHESNAVAEFGEHRIKKVPYFVKLRVGTTYTLHCKKGKSVPLQVPRWFQEVKVPRLPDNGPGWW